MMYKEIIFLITASISRSYFTKLYEVFLLEVRNKYPNVRVVPQFLLDSQEYNAEAAFGMLRQELPIINRKSSIIIVVPTLSKYFSLAVAKLSKKYNLPFIAYTLPFHEEEIFENHDVSPPPFVMSDNYAGAKSLGLQVGKHLNKMQIKLVNLLLVPGQNNRLDSITRINGFIAGLDLSNISFDQSELGYSEWNRKIAKINMIKFLTETNLNTISLVFCANDEMALGIRDAILELRNSKDNRYRKVSNCLICGYDYIEEVKRLIQSNDQYLWGSVDQDIEKLTFNLIRLIEQMNSGGTSSHRGELIKPIAINNQNFSTEQQNEASINNRLYKFLISEGKNIGGNHSTSKNNQIFVSYSHEDREWLDRIKTMLKPLERNKVLSIWDDSNVSVGNKWLPEIEQAIDESCIALFFVSPSFLASDFINDKELPKLLESSETKGITIVWVAVSACLHDESPLNQYQAACDPLIPLDTLSLAEQNIALTKLCKKIKMFVEGTPLKLDNSDEGDLSSFV